MNSTSKQGQASRFQIQKISICENVSMTSDVFIVSHCVYLVLQKTERTKTPALRASTYTVQR